ncbi:MAG: hypothetical protein NE328_18040 [Lentisphaeraceae bacterium]|nr:hypothetical protein [Lentisphaeraceae bacterium]
MRKIYLRIFYILVSAVLLVISGNSIRNTQEKNKLIIESDLPPSMQVASVALGPLKGLLVDILWWRSERMMEDKEFFESLQLSEWITSLQPTYPSVWSYQGFNLAFNISHNFSDFEERWNWILEGIKLLRDKGLEYNPDWSKNRDIRFELIHIFYRKIEGMSDTEARRFQDKWTLEMLKYFDRGNREELVEIASAPKSLDNLFKDVDIKKLDEEFKAKGADLRIMVETNPPKYSDLKNDTPENESYNAAILKIIYFVKRRAIESELNMDADRMLKTDKEYGPLDWRTHQAQIIYWGMEQEYSQFKLNGVNYSEYIRAAMLSSFFNGRVLFSEKRDYFNKTHNIEILPKLHNFFDFLLYDSGLDENSREFKRIDSIHKDFLERAIVITYTYNQIEASRELYEHYELYLPENHKGTFEQYVINGMTRSMKMENKNAIRSFIESMYFQAFQDAARGEWDRYHGYLRIAALIHRSHQLRNKDIPSKQLPPLKDISESAKNGYLESTGKKTEDLSKLESRASQFSSPKKKLETH